MELLQQRCSVTSFQAASDGLCLINHSDRGLSLKDPVNPCSVWICLSVAESGTISTIPGVTEPVLAISKLCKE